MVTTSKKFISALLTMVIVFGILLVIQVRKAGDITIKFKNAPLVSADGINIPVVDSDPTYGNPGSPLSIVEFSNIDNSKAKAIHQIVYKFVVDHPTQAQLIWKSLPETGLIFKSQPLPYLALYCSNQQSKFWPFLAELGAIGNLNENNILTAAQKTKLDLATFRPCLISTNAATALATTVSDAASLSVTAAPALFVNNRQINLDEDFDLKQMLDSFIAQ